MDSKEFPDDSPFLSTTQPDHFVMQRAGNSLRRTAPFLLAPSRELAWVERRSEHNPDSSRMRQIVARGQRLARPFNMDRHDRDRIMLKQQTGALFQRHQFAGLRVSALRIPYQDP